MPDPGSPDPTTDAGAFPAFFGVFFAIVVIVIIVSAIVAIVNAKKVVDAGHNPLTLQTELELKALDSAALAPPTASRGPSAADKSARGSADAHRDGESIEARLRKLDDLRAKKLISDDELATARAKILAE